MKKEAYALNTKFPLLIKKGKSLNRSFIEDNAPIKKGSLLKRIQSIKKEDYPLVITNEKRKMVLFKRKGKKE